MVLVGLALAALIGGAYLVGRRVNDDAIDALTASIPAEAAAATAVSNLQPALFAANSYFVDHSSYAGMTAELLRSTYDAGLAPGIKVEDATASGFCVEITINEQTFSYLDRKGTVAPGNGC
ncbi:MAG: hypothetical protein ABIR67_07915 [Gaiellaceae bacterium]